MDGDTVKGVRLLGWDIPTIIGAREQNLRVIALVLARLLRLLQKLFGGSIFWG